MADVLQAAVPDPSDRGSPWGVVDGEKLTGVYSCESIIISVQSLLVFMTNDSSPLMLIFTTGNC